MEMLGPAVGYFISEQTRRDFEQRRYEALTVGLWASMADDQHRRWQRMPFPSCPGTQPFRHCSEPRSRVAGRPKAIFAASLLVPWYLGERTDWRIDFAMVARFR